MTETVTQERKLKLWFFRDMSSAQRLKLFSIWGLPVEEIGDTHGRQELALEHVLAALRQSDTSEGGGEWIDSIMDQAIDAYHAEAGTTADWDGVKAAIKVAISRLNKSPTPEHVEGDVLSADHIADAGKMVGEMEVLARRLRDYRPPALDPAHSREHHPICDEAADALTSATTRIQRAERERDEAVAKRRELLDRCVRLNNRAELAEAQLADAVKVLKEIATDTKHTTFGEARTWGAKTAQSFLSTIGEKPDAE